MRTQNNESRVKHSDEGLAVGAASRAIARQLDQITVRPATIDDFKYIEEATKRMVLDPADSKISQVGSLPQVVTEEKNKLFAFLGNAQYLIAEGIVDGKKTIVGFARSYHGDFLVDKNDKEWGDWATSPNRLKLYRGRTDLPPNSKVVTMKTLEMGRGEESLDLIQVEKDYQGQGVASALIQKYEEIATAARGAAKCKVEIDTRNLPSINLFTKHGYKPQAIDPDNTSDMPTKDGGVVTCQWQAFIKKFK